MIKQANALLNRLLVQDEMAMAALPDIAGKTIVVEVQGPEIRLAFACQADSIALALADETTQADVTVCARPVTYLGLLISHGRDDVTFPRDMEITGDVGVAQRFQVIMKNLEIDWEEYLSHWLGDTMARKLGNLARDVNRYSRETLTTLGMDISEYLRFEKEVVPDRSQVEEFNSAVDDLRNDVERLRQRITRLDSQNH